MEIELDIRPVPTDAIALLDESQSQRLDSFLADRIYEFNAEITGYADGKLLGACIRSDAGEIIAGLSGYTWGGCAEISYLWVHHRHRGRGLGKKLLQAAEMEARRRGCRRLVVMTHSFQAPQFYERLGYEHRFAIEGQPRDHSNMVYIKLLQACRSAAASRPSACRGQAVTI
jgi:GNAT superfamily N-acetyltransferase